MRRFGKKMLQSAIASAVLLCSASPALSARSDSDQIVRDGIAKLRAANATIIWDRRSAVVAKVTCSNEPDVVILGHTPHSTWLGVAANLKAKKMPELLEFPAGKGICEGRLRIHVSPLDCQSDVGPLEGCKQNRLCEEISLENDDCDPVNIYWNAKRRTLDWWRN